MQTRGITLTSRGATMIVQKGIQVYREQVNFRRGNGIVKRFSLVFYFFHLFCIRGTILKNYL